MRLILAAALLASTAPAAAQTIHQYGALAIAPKGDRIATIESAGKRGVVTVRSTVDGRVLRTIDPCQSCG